MAPGTSVAPPAADGGEDRAITAAPGRLCSSGCGGRWSVYIEFMRNRVDLTATQAPAATVLIRLMVGAVFVSEGIQKFINAEEVGAGRFAKIGLPNPEFLAPLVGGCEIGCGLLVLLGLFTRLAVIPLLTITAMDSRTDFAMTMGSLFLLIVGAGKWSWDHRFSQGLPRRG